MKLKKMQKRVEEKVVKEEEFDEDKDDLPLAMRLNMINGKPKTGHVEEEKTEAASAEVNKYENGVESNGAKNGNYAKEEEVHKNHDDDLVTNEEENNPSDHDGDIMANEEEEEEPSHHHDDIVTNEEVEDEASDHDEDKGEEEDETNGGEYLEL